MSSGCGIATFLGSAVARASCALCYVSSGQGFLVRYLTYCQGGCAKIIPADLLAVHVGYNSFSFPFFAIVDLAHTSWPLCACGLAREPHLGPPLAKGEAKKIK